MFTFLTLTGECSIVDVIDVIVDFVVNMYLERVHEHVRPRFDKPINNVRKFDIVYFKL